MLDNRLLWADQYRMLERNVNFGTAKLNRAKVGMSQKQRPSLYHAFVQPHLEYCSLVCSAAALKLRTQLAVAQRQAVRAVTDYCGSANSATFQRLRIMPVFHKRREKLFWLYKIRNKNCRMPTYLHDLVAFHETSVGYNLRRSQRIEAAARLKIGENGIAWRFRFFFKLSEDVWNLNFTAFRSKIQTLLQDGFSD